jgi:hypothetical protein
MIHAFVWAYRQPGLSPTNKLVLMGLADHADRDGICWPGIKLLCEETGYSKSTIYRALEELHAVGLISKVDFEGRKAIKLALPNSQSGNENSQSGNRTNNKGNTHRNTPPTPPEGEVVFKWWKETFRKTNGVKLDRKRLSKIKARLKEGFTVDDLKAAITGAKADPFLMGKNDDRKKYDDLVTILRDAPQVERLIEQSPTTQQKRRGPRKTEADWIHFYENQAGLEPDEAKEQAEWQMSQQR